MGISKNIHGPWLDPVTIKNTDVPILKYRRLKGFRGGSLELRTHKRKPSSWVLHYTIMGMGGDKRVHHAITVGNINDLPTREMAEKAADVFRRRIKEGCHLELKNSPKTKYLVHYKAYYTKEQYQQALVKQDGKCAICGDEPARLHFDHDHKSGALRGLLCTHCNKAIGLLKDNPDFCESAAVYLRKFGKMITKDNTREVEC